ncbi:hypothetical protein KUV57_13145 [Epibacterium sp. DP7N7-1]|nr:hypothetical protein [Epibacterium sp. DP7N7-1]
MLSFIPSMMLVTAMLVFAFAPDLYKVEESRGAVMGKNLQLYHLKSVEQAMDAAMTYGTISGALTGPFNKLGGWETEVYSGGHRTVVITHLPDGIDGESKATLQAFSEVDARMMRSLPETYSGTYIYSEAGTGGTIGGGDFSDMQLPVIANTPAIITIIDQSYSAAGMGAGGNGTAGSGGQG